jgi:hypothetical protein
MVTVTTYNVKYDVETYDQAYFAARIKKTQSWGENI